MRPTLNSLALAKRAVSLFSSRAAALVSRVSRLRRCRARALLSLKLKKKRDCSQSMGLHAAIIRLSPLIHEGEQLYKSYIVGDPQMVSLLWCPLWKILATPLWGLWVIVAMKVRSKTTYSYLFRKIHRRILHYKGRQTCDICSLANRFLRLGMVKARIESARTKSSLSAYYT